MAEQLLKVLCGPCGGKMRVRRAGEAVVCPHCSSHLRVPMDVKAGMRLEAESGSGVLDRVASRSGVLKKGDSQIKKAPPPTRANESVGVSKNAFVIVASYASAVTLALLWLLFSNRSHQLESLPDVRTLSEGEFEFATVEAVLPAGHVLALNESVRFGDVRVTPLRVTREPISFVHYEDPSASSPPSRPVLKLWLKFENLASDVAFPPYDTALMSYRAQDSKDPNLTRANTFLCRANQRRTPQNVVLNYNHPVDSEWDLGGQANGPLAANAECTTYVASAEKGVELMTAESGQLVWRVQFRKGISRSSRKGVTTLIDVTFSTDDIGA